MIFKMGGRHYRPTHDVSKGREPESAAWVTRCHVNAPPVKLGKDTYTVHDESCDPEPYRKRIARQGSSQSDLNYRGVR